MYIEKFVYFLEPEKQKQKQKQRINRELVFFLQKLRCFLFFKIRNPTVLIFLFILFNYFFCVRCEYIKRPEF